MIHQHHHPRHHFAFTHYIPYIILAIAAVALVFLLVTMMIPEIPSIQTSPASSPLISPQQRAQQYWQFEASRWQAIADTYAKTTRPLTALEKYSYNLTGEAIPGRLETSSGFRADAIPYQAKPWLQPAVKQGFRADAIPYQAKPWLKQDAQARATQQSMSAADRYGYNLTGESVPGRLPATQDNLISPLNVDQHTRNLIAQYVPGLLSTQPYFEEEYYGYNYFKQHLNNDR
jgi:hypothetical protein